MSQLRRSNHWHARTTQIRAVRVRDPLRVSGQFRQVGDLPRIGRRSRETPSRSAMRTISTASGRTSQPDAIRENGHSCPTKTRELLYWLMLAIIHISADSRVNNLDY